MRRFAGSAGASQKGTARQILSERPVSVIAEYVTKPTLNASSEQLKGRSTRKILQAKNGQYRPWYGLVMV